VVLDEDLEEVDQRGVGVLEQPVQRLLLLLGGEVGREEERGQLAGLVERVRELPELLPRSFATSKTERA
jgi:hypothetical protein